MAPAFRLWLRGTRPAGHRPRRLQPPRPTRSRHDTQGETSDLPFHGWRAFATGLVRPQTLHHRETRANNRLGIDLDVDEATWILQSNHCNQDVALESCRRHQDRFKRIVSTPELPNTASPAQSTSETGVHGAIGLQQGRLSPKSGMSNPVVTLKEPNEQQNLRDWINEICTMRSHYLEEGDSAMFTAIPTQFLSAAGHSTHRVSVGS